MEIGMEVSPDKKIMEGRKVGKRNKDRSSSWSSKKDVVLGGCMRTVIPIRLSGYATDNAQGTRTLRVPKGLTSLHKIANFFLSLSVTTGEPIQLLFLPRDWLGNWLGLSKSRNNKEVENSKALFLYTLEYSALLLLLLIEWERNVFHSFLTLK